MDDRELIIDALRDYEKKSEVCADHAERQARRAGREATSDERDLAAIWKRREEDALRIRAELEDNADYIVKGGVQG